MHSASSVAPIQVSAPAVLTARADTCCCRVADACWGTLQRQQGNSSRCTPRTRAARLQFCYRPAEILMIASGKRKSMGREGGKRYRETRLCDGALTCRICLIQNKCLKKNFGMCIKAVADMLCATPEYLPFLCSWRQSTPRYSSGHFSRGIWNKLLPLARSGLRFTSWVACSSCPLFGKRPRI